MNVIGLARFLGMILIAFGFLFKRLCVKFRLDIWYCFWRSRYLGSIFFIICVAWFMVKLANLGEPDFGEYKYLLMFLFSFVFLGIGIFWSDFILVRSAAMLTLMGADYLLDMVYMHEGLVKPYFAAGVYVSIVLAMYFGVCPYRLRDISPYLFQKNHRYMKLIGLLCMWYGVGLIGLTCLQYE